MNASKPEAGPKTRYPQTTFYKKKMRVGGLVRRLPMLCMPKFLCRRKAIGCVSCLSLWVLSFIHATKHNRIATQKKVHHVGLDGAKLFI